MELLNARKRCNMFTSLFNIYAHELSDYNPWIATQMNEEGNYLEHEVVSLLNKPCYDPYIIFDNNNPVGFVVFSKQEPGSCESTTCCIDEIFIVKTSRGKGLATLVVNDFLKKEKDGICGLAVLKDNIPAIQFWEKLIKKYDTNYLRSEEGNVYIYNFKIC